MDVGLYATSYGTGYRDGTNFYLYSLPASQLLPIETALVAEQAGFHSLWFPDHVCMPMLSESEHVANVSGSRAYESRHRMLDAAVTMRAVGARTTTLKLGTSVLVAPYRNPLSREQPRRICTGTPEQFLNDLSRFAQAGYSLVALFFDCLSSREISEWDDQIRRLGKRFFRKQRRLYPRAAGTPLCRTKRKSYGNWHVCDHSRSSVSG